MDEQVKHKIEILEEHGFVDQSTVISGTKKLILKSPHITPAYWPVFWTDGDMEPLTYNDLGELHCLFVECNADPYYGDWRE